MLSFWASNIVPEMSHRMCTRPSFHDPSPLPPSLPPSLPLPLPLPLPSLPHPSQEAEQLISSKIHPQTIISGWRKAVDCARQALTDSTKDNSADPDRFKEVRLYAVGMCIAVFPSSQKWSCFIMMQFEATVSAGLYLSHMEPSLWQSLIVCQFSNTYMAMLLRYVSQERKELPSSMRWEFCIFEVCALKKLWGVITNPVTCV